MLFGKVQAMKKRIVSVWFPRLATDRLARHSASLQPELPLAITQETRGRLFVANTNQAAEHAGIQIDMTLADARAMLPGLTTQPDNISANFHLLQRLARWCHRFTPYVGIGEEYCLWLDITGCAHLQGGERPLLNDLVKKAEALGLQTKVALAGTPGTAWALSHFGPSGSIIPPGDEKKSLTPLPIRALRLPTSMIAELHRLGLKCIGDLIPLPRATLAARFREQLITRLDQALGHRPETISPLPLKKPYRTHLPFSEPIAHRAGIEKALEYLLEKLCSRLKTELRGCRRLELSICRVDGTSQTENIGTAVPSHDPRHLIRLFQEKLGQFDPGFGIESMMLIAPITEDIVPQQKTLRTTKANHVEDAHTRLIDRLSNRLGLGNVYGIAPFKSHQPGRSQQKTRTFSPHAWPSTPPRPLRLLRPPQPIDADGALESTTPPTCFHWQRRDHRIHRAEGPERIEPEWWQNEEMEVRDYWRIEDTGGQRFWLYRNTNQRWFLHGLFS
jgi:protein ImuB